jgi:hypothetical protein
MEHFPIIAIEGILVLGGALLFAWWQFRDLDREAAKTKQREADEKQRRESGTDSIGLHNDPDSNQNSHGHGNEGSEGH